ncbi:hypothetical protein Cni_G12983 [Canna indica]|uniref:LRAT domain-containing protein n=1 Tax=Canna indica TaxID=4628 RepID=A0AAQ3KD57_9LILI|nr:hypothetical protein Cni_G12983 [Canna indica]
MGLHNKISRDQLEVGDHIYVWRKLYAYAHHGIYVGDNRVIHFTAGDGNEISAIIPLAGVLGGSSSSSSSAGSGRRPCKTCGSSGSASSSQVVRTCLDCFLRGHKLRRFEYSNRRSKFLLHRGGTCSTLQSDPSDEVVRRAFYLLRHGFMDYSLEGNNCEDFARYCKTALVPKPDKLPTASGQLLAKRAAVKGVKALIKGDGLHQAIENFKNDKFMCEDPDNFVRKEVEELVAELPQTIKSTSAAI